MRSKGLQARVGAGVLALVVLVMIGCQSGVRQVTVRIATFNTALSRDTQGALAQAMASGEDKQARLVAEVLQRTRPDVVVLQEFDLDISSDAYVSFIDKYLAVSQNGAEPIRYHNIYATHVNTGLLAPVDLDGDGKITRPNDCYGYGLFEGQYGYLVLSNLPFQSRSFRGIRKTLWKDVPGIGPPPDYYSDEALGQLRLSSKVHLNLAVLIHDKPVHLLISHPTPPVFDGPEDRNGRRNYDEIGLWLHYLDKPQPVDERTLPFPRLDETHPDYPTDVRSPGTRFVIMGDLNADPNDGESRPGAVNRLLEHPRINSKVTPTSRGAVEAARLQGGKNKGHRSDPAADTADFGDTGDAPGNLRVDYVLPSVGLDVVGSGVYWPTADDPHTYLNAASDHKLVWIDLRLPDSTSDQR